MSKLQRHFKANGPFAGQCTHQMAFCETFRETSLLPFQQDHSASITKAFRICGEIAMFTLAEEAVFRWVEGSVVLEQNVEFYT